MASSEKLLGMVKDVVLPVDVRTRYDVYFTDRRVAIVCLGRATRFEFEEIEQLSAVPSLFGVPSPMASNMEKTKIKESVDEKIKDWPLDDILKISKKSCFYTYEEIEEAKLVWGKTPKFVILSNDCESKFSPDEDQCQQLFEIISTIEGLKDKLWITGKWSDLCNESPMALTCKFCGSSNELDTAYCQSCGKRLGDETVNIEPSSELTCSSCGTKNKAQASFCKRCGTAIE
jgi:Double zinc ribbon